jgi:hypothetical protein
MVPQAGTQLDDGVWALAHRAQEGDETALPALREVLQDPTVVNLLGGDLAAQAQLAIIDKLTGKTNLLFKESLRQKVRLLRAELAGPNPMPLERLLVEQVVACWLHLYHLEAIYASKNGMSPELGRYYQRSITSAQRRYLAAIKTLALIRKLAVPVLQLNIAKQQVNVAGPSIATDGERDNP